jgi:hypothetical protein
VPAKPLSAQAAAQKRKLSAAFGASVDLNSEAGRRLLDARSSHADLVDDAQAAEKEAVLDALEKREGMAAQLQSITKMHVKAFSCAQCPYGLLEHVPPLCRQAKHAVVQVTATKRFFACAHCEQRADSLLASGPDRPCAKCGRVGEWKRVSMYRGKEVAAGAAAQLQTRGHEHAFALRA